MDENSAGLVRVYALGLMSGTSLDGIDAALAAGADGIVMPHQMADRFTVQAAQDAGLTVGLGSVNDADLLDSLSRWPVDTLFTDYPSPAP